MKKATRFLLGVIIFAVLLGSSCGTPTVPATVPPRRPTQTQLPISTMGFLDLVDTVVPVPTRRVLAPACEPCAEPAVVNTSPSETFCVMGKPYQSLAAEPGAQFTPVDATLTCFDSGMTKNINGHLLHVWNCTGDELRAQRVTVTNPACRTLQTLLFNNEQCAEGLAYDTVNHCCAPFAEEAAAVVVKLNMGACR